MAVNRFRAGAALRSFVWILAFGLSLSLAVPKAAQSQSLAPGFSQLQKGTRLVVVPIDAELFSLSAGGVAEPKADWTAAAVGHMNKALADRAQGWGLEPVLLKDSQMDAHGEIAGLHAAVAQSISLHHGMGGAWKLPSKNGELNWSFADAMRPLGAEYKARYGLFIWVRDSYASAERKAAMVALALLGVGISGGVQVGYASLVDLDSGQVLWFNRLGRGTGDLREAAPAAESMNTLLAGFPAAR